MVKWMLIIWFASWGDGEALRVPDKFDSQQQCEAFLEKLNVYGRQQDMPEVDGVCFRVETV